MPLFAARLELGYLFNRFVDAAPADFRLAVPMKLRVERLRDRRMREYRTGLLLLFGAVLCFLLMACASVASMQLARAEARRQDYAVRRSLGATPSRLLQQALLESLLLASAGGTIGVALAAILMQGFAQLRPAGAPPQMQAALDARVAAFALLLSLVAAALFGALPALARLRTESLAGARIAGARRQRMRSALVALQFALSMVLLSATGLLLLSLTRLQQVQLGFRADNVVSASFLLPAAAYGTEERQIAFFQNLEDQLQAMPGTMAAAITDSLPPDGDPRSFPFVVLLGGGNAEGKGVQGLVKWRYVTPGYFAALGIPIRQGRGFADADRGCGAQPLVISESLARRLFPDGSPVGRTIPWGQVVGVAADVRNAGIRQLPDPEMYVLRCHRPNAASGNQRPPHGWRLATAVVRSSLPEPAATALLAQTIRSAGPGLAVATRTLHQDLRGEVSQTRFQTALLSVFALIGVGLAAVGLYGLTSFLAAARTREVGVRIALGATRAHIVWLMARGGVAWTLAGLAAGTVASVWVMQAMRSLLVDATAADAGVMAAAIAVLSAAAFAGMALPSARASRKDAVEALREG
ncbi:MAG: FtsX-like permease family protein [Bryobacterales bacterium]|nr:FtsX-like permease family protein [Bryobacterales bacterium]